MLFAGIVVIEKVNPENATMRLVGAEHMTVKEFFVAYAKAVKMSPEAIALGLDVLNVSMSYGKYNVKN